MVGGEGSFLLGNSWKLLNQRLPFYLWPFLVQGLGSGLGRQFGAPLCVPSTPSAQPSLMPSLALQGRLLQTKKSGYFPSSSVKPCPVDARVSARQEMELGVPGGCRW